jgi:hypothetical protein
MVDEHYHPTNHRSEVQDMDMVEVGSMDTVEEYYHLMNHWSEVQGMDREDSGMGEDMTVELEVIERENESVVLMRHWTGDGAERHRRTHREWDELVKSGCSKDYTTFASRDSNYST